MLRYEFVCVSVWVERVYLLLEQLFLGGRTGKSVTSRIQANLTKQSTSFIMWCASYVIYVCSIQVFLYLYTEITSFFSSWMHDDVHDGSKFKKFKSSLCTYSLSWCMVSSVNSKSGFKKKKPLSSAKTFMYFCGIYSCSEPTRFYKNAIASHIIQQKVSPNLFFFLLNCFQLLLTAVK